MHALFVTLTMPFNILYKPRKILELICIEFTGEYKLKIMHLIRFVLYIGHH